MWCPHASPGRNSLSSLYKSHRKTRSDEGTAPQAPKVLMMVKEGALVAEVGKKGISGLLTESLRTVWTVTRGPRMRSFSGTWPENPGA